MLLLDEHDMPLHDAYTGVITKRCAALLPRYLTKPLKAMTTYKGLITGILKLLNPLFF